MGLMIGVFATIAMATTDAISAVHADKGGDPNNSEQSQQNANERHFKKQTNFGEAEADSNPHNDNGPNIAHENMHDDTGVTCFNC